MVLKILFRRGPVLFNANHARFDELLFSMGRVVISCDFEKLLAPEVNLNILQ